jgi:hypothetical protein
MTRAISIGGAWGQKIYGEVCVIALAVRNAVMSSCGKSKS